MSDFLPVCREDLISRGIDKLDFVFITGDAYVDHPSFGVAIISRVLEAKGFTVGIIAQPDIKKDEDFKKLGLPRLGFLVTSGNIDSMVSNYTVAKKKRTEDLYSPGGKALKRPDRAVIVYCNKLRKIYGNVPIIIGGLEASLRRFAHYDYWDNCVRQSILFDSGADLLSYGMGELSIVEIANALKTGVDIKDIKNIRGTCYIDDFLNLPPKYVECAAFEKVSSDKKSYAIASRIQQDEHDAKSGKIVIQKHGNRYLIQNPPSRLLTTEELDEIYEIPYMRYYHPSYENEGGVPAIEEVEFSIAHNRGCFGACNFCSISFHQGRYIMARSKESILRETESFTENKRFKGYIHDVGGPTANFRFSSCKKQGERGMCRGKKCLAPNPCSNLEVDHSEYLDILNELKRIKGIKKVFIRSGIRYDYLMLDKDDSFFMSLIENHISGQLKVAPEHCSSAVLDKMGKPHITAYKKFADKFYSYTKKINKEQYLVPYLMSSHPGSTLSDATELALFLKANKIRPEQVQDFYPTPGTISTSMYYTGLDPYTQKTVYVPKTPHEKAMQRALLQYFRPENKRLVMQALTAAKRTDLIGNGPNCLIAGNPPMSKVKKTRGKDNSGKKKKIKH